MVQLKHFSICKKFFLCYEKCWLWCLLNKQDVQYIVFRMGMWSSIQDLLNHSISIFLISLSEKWGKLWRLDKFEFKVEQSTVFKFSCDIVFLIFWRVLSIFVLKKITNFFTENWNCIVWIWVRSFNIRITSTFTYIFKNLNKKFNKNVLIKKI